MALIVFFNNGKKGECYSISKRDESGRGGELNKIYKAMIAESRKDLQPVRNKF